MAFIVMAGDAFGSFTLINPHDYRDIKDVSWQTGRLGLEAVTRFPQRELAENAAKRVHGTDNHIPEVFEVTD